MGKLKVKVDRIFICVDKKGYLCVPSAGYSKIQSKENCEHHVGMEWHILVRRLGFKCVPADAVFKLKIKKNKISISGESEM